MSDYSEIFGRELEPWREPLGALRLTLADEHGPSWQIERARAECEALVKVLNEYPPADQGKPQITESTHDRDRLGICCRCGRGITAAEVIDGEKPCVGQGKPQVTEAHRPQRLNKQLRSSLIDFAKDRIQAVWDDVGETDAETLAENVVSAQEFAWISAQIPIVTDERVEAGKRGLAHRLTYPSLHWPDTAALHHADVADAVVRAVLEAALGGRECVPEHQLATGSGRVSQLRSGHA